MTRVVCRSFAWSLLGLVSALALMVNGGCESMPTTAGPTDAGDRSPTSARTVLESARDKAVSIIIRAVSDNDPFTRARAVEAAHMLPDHLAPLISQALDDNHRAVRFSALVTVGKFRMLDFADSAESVLVKERVRETELRTLLESTDGALDPARKRGLSRAVGESRSVQAAALFAMKRCGRDVNLTPMAAMLQDDDPYLRSNVVMLLGHLGDPSAIGLLKLTAESPMQRAKSEEAALARLQLAEALTRLGDESMLQVIRSAVYSEFHEVRALAVQIMGDLGDRRWQPGLLQILRESRNNLELRLVTARSLAKMGNFDGRDLVIEGGRSQTLLFREVAAHALGYFDDAASARFLVQLLNDPQQRVRLAAARAVLQAVARQSR